jgi:hypothetical protein
MDYDPIGNMLDGTSKGTVDPVLQEQADENNKLRQQEIEVAQQAQDYVAEVEQQEQQKQQEIAASENENILVKGAKNIVRGGIEAPTALVGGAIDAFEQVGERFNQSWMEIPDEWEPQNKTPWGQAARELITAVGPTVALALLTRRGTAALGKASGLPNPPKWVKFVGNAGTDAAAGVAWDSVGRHAEDHNLSGTLKKGLPNWFGWIPDDIATLDTDSPDLKRSKNVSEGVGLGLLTSAAEGAIALARATKKLLPGVEFFAKDSTAKKNLDEIAKKAGEPFSDNPMIDRLMRDENYRAASDEEMAIVRYNKNGAETPDPFVHAPVYDDAERLPKSVRPDGVMQAMVDAKRIEDNIGTTYGRMASFMSNAAVEQGVDMADVAGRGLVKKIEDAIRKTGNFEAKLPNGKMLGKKELLKSADNLMAAILDPAMSGEDVRKMFDTFDLKDTKALDQNLKLGYINDRAYAAAMKSIKELKDLYLNLDTTRASAYLQTSLAGEAADLASAVRHVGDAQDITRAQELILDKMQVLWYETDMASSIAGWSLNNKRTWPEVLKSGDAQSVTKFAKETKAKLSATALAKAESRATFLNNLREINKTNPEYLKPLSLAYELTDGNVNSIHKLNKYMDHTLGTWKKAFVDGNANMPSIVVQGLFSTFYNLKLSSLMTPVKALSNNFALLLMKPANVLLGAALRRDTQMIHRAWVQYATHMDTTVRAGADYMGQMFRRVAADPTTTQRADFVTRNNDLLEVSKRYAEAEAKNGNLYPMWKVGLVEQMNAINDHPWFRYSMNFMEAGDAFVKSTVAMAEARGRAFDQLVKEGKKITTKEVEAVAQDIYRKMFNADGLLTDDAVKYASGEIAMNLDNEVAQGLNNLLNKAPIAKTLILFPRTSINALDFVHKHSPLSVFAGEMAKIRQLKEVDEITEFLATKGIKYSEQNWNAFKTEAVGRVAMGTTLMGYAGWMFVSGNLTGNGHYDKQVNRFAQNTAERPLRSWRGIDGKWRSYDGIEPIATFLAFTADVLDNIETLGSSTGQELLLKGSYALSMNLTSKTFLSGLEPLVDITQGKGFALDRWAANTASAGIMTQMARLMMPGLREVDNDLMSQLRNKWNLLDATGIGKPLPYKYDFIDGGVVGREGPIDNILNNLLPFKTRSDPSPEKQLLIDAEFDVQPSLKTSLGKVTYDVFQRSRLSQLMGENQTLKKGLTKLLSDPRVKNDLKMIAALRRKGVTSDDLQISGSYTHIRLRQLVNQSVNQAKRQLASESTSGVRPAEVRKRQLDNALKQQRYGALLDTSKQRNY